MMGVSVDQGGSIVEVTRNGVGRSIGRPKGRGTRVVIDCTCENDHRFDLVIHFCKGCTYITTENAAFIEEDEERSELWRD
jgi:hypothetical protein